MQAKIRVNAPKRKQANTVLLAILDQVAVVVNEKSWLKNMV
jgi:hypothetical protein